jgi:galactokinase
MDQLSSAAGIAGHALLLDCKALTLEPVPVPDDFAVVVIHSGQARVLRGSPYAERRAACESAAAVVGPLRDATLVDLEQIDDDTVRRRARHVVTENARVLSAAAALRAGDAAAFGVLMNESHHSLRDDFEVSTPALDSLVARLRATPGVHGARLTGAGFGGGVVAVAEPGALDDGWTVVPSDGARLLSGP